MPHDTDAPQPPTQPRANGRSWPTAAPSTTPPPPSATGPPAGEDRWTVGRLLSWTTDYLKRRGAESPRLDAEVLLARVLGWQRVQLYTHFEEEVGERPRADFRDLVRRRAEGAPVAYLVGRKEFYSLPLRVSPAVLIPRPDSEFVVVEFLAAVGPLEAPRGVDVGTGSGCLALACAHEKKGSRWVAIDVSPEALAVAAGNAEALGLADRVEFRRGSLLEPVAGEGPFDVIVSNPPYIPTGVIPTLEPGVRDHEPHGALDGGEDGLRVVAPLIEQAVPLLKPGGHLILEIGTDQEGPIRALLGAQPGLRLAPTVRDHANHPRVVRATRVD
ncbi:MAG: peptide chain release factor N(5)-glutamine methyltransferase [Planctomycetia bacterium]|nr:peptide chain release factor N(5)-glutamine methyltransferase [Planctomycetia bacterium]